MKKFLTWVSMGVFLFAGVYASITMDIAEEDGQMYYYIHWIDVTCDGAEAGEVIKGRMERWLRRVWK